MTSNKIYDAVRWLYGNCDHRLHNVFIYNWESDFFAITKAGYAVEVEVKVSRSDFFADFKKPKHRLLADGRKRYHVMNLGEGYESHRVPDPDSRWGWKYEKTPSTRIKIIKPYEHLPNRFYFACPQGLIKPEEVPDYAGLIYVPETFMSQPCYEVKKAPFLHKIKQSYSSELLGKYHHRTNLAIRELMTLEFDLGYEQSREDTREFVRRLIKQLK